MLVWELHLKSFSTLEPFVNDKSVKHKLRRNCMQQNQPAKGNSGSIMKPEFAGTDAQKVKQQIQKM
ncbi:hypothetical protein KEH51_01535 [[Brevibacterium] frigoritolerans]|uniref:Uncharacterized protein n=1 Tax=Peribacillus frigoritolerans TaxID=450367 RepID=A0A941FJG1_9BACI|nr:hypothetical protein [Peribacillus frigoritolerans]